MARRTVAEPEAPLSESEGGDAAPDAVQVVMPSESPVSEPAIAPPAPVPEPARRNGFVAPLIGGALAAGLGFGLSHFDALGIRPTVDATETTAALDRQATEITALKEALAVAEAGFADRLNKVEAAASTLPAPFDPAAIEDRLAALEKRLAAIELLGDAGGATSPAIVASLRNLESQVAELRANAALPDEVSQKVDAALAQLAEAEAEAKANAAEAAALSDAAVTKAVLDRLAAALESGGAFAAELSELKGATIPAPLADHAATGLVTMAALSEQFPEAARSALQVARVASGEDGWGARLTEFLKAQTGARSLTARDGSDPDAILSRAEAALQAGRLAGALTELEGLDPEVSAAMADWTASAKIRLEAEAAFTALMAQLAPQGE